MISSRRGSLSLLQPLPWDMARRNSLEPISFMDFAFFPVKGEVAELATKLPDQQLRSAANMLLPPRPFQFTSVDPNTASSLQVIGNLPSSGCCDPQVTSDVSESSPSLADASEHSQAGDDQAGHRFKPFHEEKWTCRYKELLIFHREHGHSAVPHTYPKNPQLARWVKRQRRQYKLLKDGRPSTMTADRLELLNSTGFVWDSHDVNWREKLDSLSVFRQEHGHCNVPSNYKDKKLATWVKCQRRQYKLYWDGKPSAMTPDRIAQLERSGFEWEIRAAAPKTATIPEDFTLLYQAISEL